MINPRKTVYSWNQKCGDKSNHNTTIIIKKKKSSISSFSSLATIHTTCPYSARNYDIIREIRSNRESNVDIVSSKYQKKIESAISTYIQRQFLFFFFVVTTEVSPFISNPSILCFTYQKGMMMRVVVFLLFTLSPCWIYAREQHVLRAGSVDPNPTTSCEYWDDEGVERDDGVCTPNKHCQPPTRAVYFGWYVIESPSPTLFFL